MSNVIDLRVTRRAISEVCGSCEYPDFCIVNDFSEGEIVVCDNCGAVAGKLVTEEHST